MTQFPWTSSHILPMQFSPSAKPARVIATSRYIHFDSVRHYKHVFNIVKILHVWTSTLITKWAGRFKWKKYSALLWRKLYQLSRAKGLHYSQTKREVNWWLATDVSGKHDSPVFKRQAEESVIASRNVSKQQATYDAKHPWRGKVWSKPQRKLEIKHVLKIMHLI